MPGAKIYYRNESERARLQEKYPELDAVWLPVPEKMKDSEGPLVCRDNEPLEKCRIGEIHIEKMYYDSMDEED